MPDPGNAQVSQADPILKPSFHPCFFHQAPPPTHEVHPPIDNNQALPRAPAQKAIKHQGTLRSFLPGNLS